MSLIRTVKQKENPYVQIDKTFLSDDRLSWSAKGILAYILSKPDGWKIRKEDIIKKSDDGRSKVDSALLNLMACGYVNWYQLKSEGGTFGEWVYDVYERPEYNPNLVLCIEEGTARINERKSKVKKKNETKENSPKVDNPISDSPKVDYPISDNQLYSNNDFINNDLNKEEEEEEEKLTHISFLSNFFTKNISPTAKQLIELKFAMWLKLLPFDVIKLELENCALHGAKSWKYVEKALLGLKAANVTTIEEVAQKHAEYEANRTNNKPKSFKGNGNKSRKEQLPEWFESTDQYYTTGGAAAKSAEEIKKEQDEINQLLASFGGK